MELKEWVGLMWNKTKNNGDETLELHIKWNKKENLTPEVDANVSFIFHTM